VLPPHVQALLDQADVVLASDEAGLGAYAGPLVVSAVLAPKGWAPRVTILTDSKKMDDAQRRVAAKALIADERIWWVTQWTHSPDIDEENVYRSNIRMHTNVIATGLQHAEVMHAGKRVLAVVDGNLDIPQAISLPKADLRILACSAASVLAKVARDTWMAEKMHPLYPQYGFDKSYGYGVPYHEQALRDHGPCPIHRRSFDPIARLIRKPDGPNVLDLIEQLAKDDQ
jgi:ribonuclease HII